MPVIHRVFTQKFWHQLFEAGIALKALNSVWQTFLGTFLLVHTHKPMRAVEFANNHLENFSDGTRIFAGVYLLFHGLLNMFLVYNLYKNRLWAYPFAIIVVSFFALYQVYRFTYTYSVALLLLTLFDIIFIVLTWHEYEHQKKHRHTIAI